MKFRLIALGIISSTVGVCTAATNKTDTNYEFWNKTKTTLYVRHGSGFAESGARTDLGNKNLVPINSNDFIKSTLGPDDKIVVVQFARTETGPKEAYRINRDSKTVYIQVKETKGKLVFGPQTEPPEGVEGKTKRGYPLDKNVTLEEIRKS